VLHRSYQIGTSEPPISPLNSDSSGPRRDLVCPGAKVGTSGRRPRDRAAPTDQKPQATNVAPTAAVNRSPAVTGLREKGLGPSRNSSSLPNRSLGMVPGAVPHSQLRCSGELGALEWGSYHAGFPTFPVSPTTDLGCPSSVAGSAVRAVPLCNAGFATFRAVVPPGLGCPVPGFVTALRAVPLAW